MTWISTRNVASPLRQKRVLSLLSARCRRGRLRRFGFGEVVGHRRHRRRSRLDGRRQCRMCRIVSVVILNLAPASNRL
jgi:hypothetical protein